jgi:peptidoglycan/xylan/chitin deacetylase (PgdA/CDA1 family)
VLIFHRVLAEPDPLVPDLPDASWFQTQMQWVSRWFNVLRLEEAAERLKLGSLPERALCITFDDGYADNHRIALGILQSLGLTATFFVATGFLNGGRMWNDTLIEAVRAVDGPTLDLRPLGLGVHAIGDAESKRRTIGSLIGAIRHLPAATRSTVVERVAELSPKPLSDALMMAETEVRALHGSGMTIGAHTVSHPILSRLAPEAARAEIAEGKSTLEQIVGERVVLFAYPNGKPGLDYGPEHVAIVKELGFSAAVSTAWGVARTGCDVYQIPRFTPWDRHAWKYGFRLARNLARARYDTVEAERPPGSTLRHHSGGVT